MQTIRSVRLEQENLDKLRAAFKGHALSKVIETVVLKYMDDESVKVKPTRTHKSTSVSLDVATAQRLDDFSQNTGVPVAAIIRLAIELELEKKSKEPDTTQS